MKRIQMAAMLLATSWLVAGCTEQENESSVATTVEAVRHEQNIEALTAVIEKEFTAPDTEIVRIKANLEEKLNEVHVPGQDLDFEAVEPELREMDALMKERYSEHFTFEGFHAFATEKAFNHHEPNREYDLDVNSIEIIPHPNDPTRYTFTYVVKHEYADTKMEHQLEGRATLPIAGKIDEIHFGDQYMLLVDTHD